MNRPRAPLPARCMTPPCAKAPRVPVPAPMQAAHVSLSRLLMLITSVVAGAMLLMAPALRAQPALGNRQEFGAGTGGWSGGLLGGITSTNPGAGGRIGDGFLKVTSPALGNFGNNCRFCPEYVGDWTAAGITQVRLWLNDVGADDFFEMHFALGTDTNFWLYTVGYTPPEGEWAEFVVDLTDVGNWTRTIGLGTFPAALSAVSNILIRHDLAPYIQAPDPTVGDIGIDSILLTNGLVGIGPSPRVSAIRLAAPYPNPSRGAVTFALELPDTEPVRIQIIDVTGRSIRNAEIAGGASGPRTWMWDGRDDAGRPAPAGAYRVRASGDAGAISRPFTRIR